MIIWDELWSDFTKTVIYILRKHQPPYTLHVKYAIYGNHHNNDVITGAMASHITGVSIFLLNCWFRRKSKKTSKLRGIHLWPVNSPHKWLVTRKMFPFDNVIMILRKHIPRYTLQVKICNMTKAQGKHSVLTFWFAAQWHQSQTSFVNL